MPLSLPYSKIEPVLKFYAYRSVKGSRCPLSFSDSSTVTACGYSITFSSHIQHMGWRQVRSLDQTFSRSRNYLLRILSSKLWNGRWGQNSLETQGHAQVDFRNGSLLQETQEAQKVPLSHGYLKCIPQFLVNTTLSPEASLIPTDKVGCLFSVLPCHPVLTSITEFTYCLVVGFLLSFSHTGGEYVLWW